MVSSRDGWGLGLYIVKTIILSHGEDVYVTSRDGVTEFSFTLPKAPQYASGRKEEGLRTAKEKLSVLQKKGSLLIERVEYMASIDLLEEQYHSEEVPEELQSWYYHVGSIIRQIISHQ